MSRSSPSQAAGRVIGGWFGNTPRYSSTSWLKAACLRECCGRAHMGATDACVLGRMIKFRLGAVFVIYFFFLETYGMFLPSQRVMWDRHRASSSQESSFRIPGALLLSGFIKPNSSSFPRALGRSFSAFKS